MTSQNYLLLLMYTVIVALPLLYAMYVIATHHKDVNYFKSFKVNNV